MRGLHLVVALAAVAVGFVVFLLARPDTGRRTEVRREAVAPAPRRAGGAPSGIEAPRAVAVAVRGHVYAGRDTPLPGATVDALDGRGERAASTQSGADGGYLLQLPATGLHVLRAWAPDHGAERLRSREIARDLTGVDFHLASAEAISGSVVDEEGRPVAGARVEVAEARRGAEPVAETRTANDGTFALSAPSVARVSLTAGAAGYAPVRVDNLPLPVRDHVITLARGIAVRLRTLADGLPAPDVLVECRHRQGRSHGHTDAQGMLLLANLPPALRARLVLRFSRPGLAPRTFSGVDLPLVDGVVDLGDIEMGPGGTVRGRVIEEETQTPIEDAEVFWLGGSAFRYDAAREVVARSARDGSFELTGVPLDAAFVAALHPAYVLAADASKVFPRLRAEKLFAPGAVEAVCDIPMLAACAIRGVVLGPDGRPVAGAEVAGWGRVLELTAILERDRPSAVSDEDGRFALGGLRRGAELELSATHERYGPAPRLKVTAGSADPVTLRLEPPVTITGVVADESGAPIQGAWVRIMRETSARAPTQAQQVVSGSDGRWTLENVAPGEATLHFSRPGYLRVERAVALAARSEPRDLGTTVLARGPGIEGIVVDTQGLPVADVMVQAFRAGRPGFEPQAPGGDFASATTDPQGRFALYGLREGVYTLSVATPGRYASRVEAPSGSRDARLVLEAGATLKGRVLCGQEPVERAFVRAEIPGAPRPTFLAGAVTDAGGRFEIKPLPPREPVDLVVLHTEHEERRFEGVHAGREARDFVLPVGRRLAVVVTEEDGTPVGGATVRVWQEGQRMRSGLAGADGHHEFGGLSEGPLEVQVFQTPRGHVPSERIAVPPAGDEVRIVVERGLAIRGRVLLEGKDEAFAIVEALDGSGQTAATARAFGRQPSFELNGLRPGGYTLRVKLLVPGQEPEIVIEATGIQAGRTDVQLR